MGRVETLNQILEELRNAREGAGPRNADRALSPPPVPAVAPAPEPKTPGRIVGTAPLRRAAGPASSRSRPFEAALRLVAEPAAIAKLIEAPPIVALARN